MRQRWPYLLLLIPCIAMLTPPFFNLMEPQIGGFPFFYWYGIAWLVLTAAINLFVYLLLRQSGHIVSGRSDPEAGL